MTHPIHLPSHLPSHSPIHPTHLKITHPPAHLNHPPNTKQTRFSSIQLLGASLVLGGAAVVVLPSFFHPSPKGGGEEVSSSRWWANAIFFASNLPVACSQVVKRTHPPTYLIPNAHPPTHPLSTRSGPSNATRWASSTSPSGSPSSRSVPLFYLVLFLHLPTHPHTNTHSYF